MRHECDMQICPIERLHGAIQDRGPGASDDARTKSTRYGVSLTTIAVAGPNRSGSASAARVPVPNNTRRVWLVGSVFAGCPIAKVVVRRTATAMTAPFTVSHRRSRLDMICRLSVAARNAATLLQSAPVSFSRRWRQYRALSKAVAGKCRRASDTRGGVSLRCCGAHACLANVHNSRTVPRKLFRFADLRRIV
jgi:hypothetical protein